MASPTPPVLPGAEPFSAAGSGANARTGVLVCHGFTGSPQSMRPWAEHLAAEGYAVELPRLPGHGTTWQEMNTTGWGQWFAEVERALLDLAGRCDNVFVAGLSMGGTLSLRLAETHPDKVAGVVTVNPALIVEDPRLKLLPLLKHLVPSFPGIGSDIKKPGATELAYTRVPLKALASFLQLEGQTRRDLGRISCQVLTYHAVDDHVVPPSSAKALREETRPGVVTEIELTDSFHVATLDNDAPTIFAGSAEFIQRTLAGVAGADAGTVGS